VTAKPPSSARYTDLHIDSPVPVQLYGGPKRASTLDLVCRSPCDASVPIWWTYTVLTRDADASPKFELEATGREDATIAVREKSTR